MKKTSLLLALVSGLIVAGQANAQDYLVARYRMEQELNYICSTSIGVPYASATYYECRDYYDRRFYEYGLDWDYLTPAQVTAFLTRTNPYIRSCRNQGLISTLLWGCIRDYEDRYYRDWHHRNPHFKPRKDYHPHFDRRPHYEPTPKHHAPDVKPHHGPAPKHHAPDVKPHHGPDPKHHAPDVRPHDPAPKGPAPAVKKDHKPDPKPHTPDIKKDRNPAPKGPTAPKAGGNKAPDKRPDGKRP